MLITVPMAARTLKTTRDAVFEMVDDGRLRWAWDLSAAAGGRRHPRLLRILAAEVGEPGRMAGWDMDAVMAHLFGTRRQQIRAGEICDLFMVSRNYAFRLARAGEVSGSIVAHTFWIDLKTVAAFMRRRLVGAIYSRRAA